MRWLIFAILLLSVPLFVSCTEGNPQAEQVNNRYSALDKASKLYPDPELENFPLRKALVEFTRRQDEIKPWYVYLLGQNGNVIGYYIAQTVPINSCNFLSSTEKIWAGSNGASQILTAPSLDGMYYGGGGASSGCDSWFFFDEATNALIQIRGMNFYAADEPLLLEADPILVAPK